MSHFYPEGLSYTIFHNTPFLLYYHHTEYLFGSHATKAVRVSVENCHAQDNILKNALYARSCHTINVVRMQLLTFIYILYRYTLMLQCWSAKPSLRPTFASLGRIMTHLAKNTAVRYNQKRSKKSY